MNNWSFFRGQQPKKLQDCLEDWGLFWAENWPEDLTNLANTPQSPTFHAEGDVYTHTKMVLTEMSKHPRFLSGTAQEKTVLILAAMLHDVAKSWTTQTIQGEIRAPMHSKKGAVEIRKRLWMMDVDPFTREQVCNLVMYHQAPFFALAKDGQTAEFLAKKISCDVDISLLNALAESDIRGRVCHDQQKVLDDIALFGEVAKELSCFSEEYSWPNSLTRSHFVRSHGKIYSDTPSYQKDFEVILLSGLPASGKDTWAKNQDVPMISYDAIRLKHKYKHGTHTGEIVHEAHDMAREFLRKKQSFIWNATHLSSDMRAPASQLIRQYGAAIYNVCFEASFSDTMQRNTERSSSIPNTKIVEMAGKWETPFAWEFDRASVVLNSNFLITGKTKKILR